MESRVFNTVNSAESVVCLFTFLGYSRAERKIDSLYLTFTTD